MSESTETMRFVPKRFFTQTYATRRGKKEDGKPCVTSVTIILFEITLRQTSLSFETDVFCKDQKTLMLSEDHDITRKQ